jgi:hypothetical protein
LRIDIVVTDDISNAGYNYCYTPGVGVEITSKWFDDFTLQKGERGHGNISRDD